MWRPPRGGRSSGSCGSHLAHLFYVRLVLNVASGIGIYVLVVNRRWTRETLLRLGAAVTILYAGVTLVGLGFHWFSVPIWRTYLTLFLTGPYTGGFVGLGSNTSFFAQYALAYLPVIALVALERSGRPRWLAAGALVVSAYTLPATNQRGAYVVLLLELGLFAVVGGMLARDRVHAAMGRAAVAVTVAVVLVVAALLVSTPLGPSTLENFVRLWHERGEPVRTQTLRITGEIFRDYPLLGVGTGRFAHVFPLYARPSDAASNFFQNEPGWSTHNLYAQLLAEQGLVGLASFLLMIAAVLVPIVRAQRRPGDDRPAVFLLLVSVGAWLTYGFLYYTFLLRSMQLYFWITLGLLVSVTSAVAPPVRVPRRWLAAGSAALLVLFGLRTYTVAIRPITPGLAAGVHSEWEYWADPLTRL